MKWVKLVATLAVCGAGVGPMGCGRSERPFPEQEVVLSEGVGLERLCVIGDSISSAKKRLGPAQVRRHYGERGSGEEYEYQYAKSPIVIGTVDTPDGEAVARVSVWWPHQGPHADATGSAPRRVRTKGGLELSPAGTTPEDVKRAYGEPEASFERLDDPHVWHSIVAGRSYVIRSLDQDHFLYIHHPGLGIAFLFEENRLVKCSVQAPRKRVIWRY